MHRLFACIISETAASDRELLIAVARQFSYRLEVLDDGVLFDVMGLEKLIGGPDQIAEGILDHLRREQIAGNVAVATTVDAALLLARHKKGVTHTITSEDKFHRLPLRDLAIERDLIGIFDELGINSIDQLRRVPMDDLISRYGQQFRNVLDILDQKEKSFLTPNVKESKTEWRFELDFAVDDFEQLVFIINHGLDELIEEVAANGLSTEQLDISLGLCNKTTRTYEIKTSFPTLEKAFWLKLINLRVSLDAPETAILSVCITAHFTKGRPDQKGLYAVSRPAPESLLLTVNKIKKLVGHENVGVPVLVDTRLAEAFALDLDKMPVGIERTETGEEKTIIGFNYYRPPRRAEVLVREGRLTYVKTKYFNGHVLNYSGVWKASSAWWDRSWRTHEWDVEIEDQGVYRLCKADKEWFLTGEYD